jgi:hypothetical protein
MLKEQDSPSGGFIAKEVDGVGDKRLGYATTVVVATCRPFWRTNILGIICLNLQSITISGVSASGLKKFYRIQFNFQTCKLCTFAERHRKLRL